MTDQRKYLEQYVLDYATWIVETPRWRMKCHFWRGLQKQVRALQALKAKEARDAHFRNRVAQIVKEVSFEKRGKKGRGK